MAAKPIPIPLLALCLGATMHPQPASAEPHEAWTVSGSLRLRYETLSGQFRPGFDAEDDLVSLRTTILVQYDPGPVQIAAELYDSRAYGGEPGSAVSASDVDALEPVQAYVAADVRLGDRGTGRLQAGRFIMKLGSHLRVDEEEYRNTNPAFTGVRADLQPGNGTSATLFYALPHLRLPDDPPSIRANKVRFDRESFDLAFWGGMITRTRGWRNISFDAGYSRLRERDSPGHPTRNRRLHSLMSRFVRLPAPRRFDFAVEADYQFGTIRAGLAPDAVRLEVSATYFHAGLGYSFGGPLRLRLAIDYDRASGDGRGRGYGRFDPLFGVRRPDLAPTGIYSALGRANISAPAVQAEIAPGPRWDAFAIVRALWAEDATDSFSATGVRDPSGTAGRFAGFHLGARLRYWLIPDQLRAELNAVRLVKGGLLVHAPNAPASGDTTYLSATLTASF